MKTHWTERSVKDYLYRIATDFIAQLEKKMELDNITQDKLAERLSITKGRVSQLFNHPGNITLGNVVKFSRTLGMKVSIVAYDDGDTENKNGPIDSEIFSICWEKLNKPRDFWAIQEIEERMETASNKIEDKKFYHPESILGFTVSQKPACYIAVGQLENYNWNVQVSETGEKFLHHKDSFHESSDTTYFDLSFLRNEHFTLGDLKNG